MSRVHHQKQIGGRSGKHVTSLEYRQAEVDFFGEQRGPAAVSMMNRCVETLTCYVGTTCMMSGLSVWRRHEFVWKKGSVRKFEGLAGLMWGYFIFFLRGGGGEEEKRTESIKRYKLFLAAASEDRIGFSNDFPALPATLYRKFPEL